MPGHVDDVVDAAHDIEVAVVVAKPGVSREIEPRMLRQIGPEKAFVVLPQRRERSGRQRQPDDQPADLVRSGFLAGIGEHADVVARNRTRRRSGLHRQQAKAGAVRDRGPAKFRLPPVIDDRYMQPVSRPQERIRIAAFSGQEQQPETRQIVPRHVEAVRVLALDGAESRRSGKQDVDAVLRADAPVRARIRRSDRLPFIQNRRDAVQERSVDDVAVPDRPADVGGCPEDLSGADAENVAHAPGQRDGVAPVVAHDAFWNAGRA